MEVQIGQKIAVALVRRYTKWHEMFYVPFTSFLTVTLEEKTTEYLIKQLDWVENSMWFKWTNWIPSDWLDSDWCRHLIWFTYEKQLHKRIKAAMLNQILGLIVVLSATLFVNTAFILLSLPLLFGLAGTVQNEKRRMYDSIAEDNNAMPLIMKVYRDRHIKWITGACAAVAVLYGLVIVYKAIRAVPASQGNLNPSTMGDILIRDTEKSEWAIPWVAPMPCTEKARTTTVDQLEKLVESNLCFITLEVNRPDGSTKAYCCDAFFPKSNVAIIPRHMWTPDGVALEDIKVQFTRHDPDKIGGNFTAFLYRKHSYDIPNTDLCVVSVANGGDWKDLTPYLPLERFADVPARLVYKQNDGSTVSSHAFMKCQEVNTTIDTYFGATYDLDFDTFKGLCMAPLITETKGPLIGGFHLGGATGTPQGCSGLLLKADLDAAIEALNNVEFLIIAPSSGNFPESIYDVQLTGPKVVHPSSALNWVPYGSNIMFFCQTMGRATYHSEVMPTVITDAVHKVCEEPNVYGPPQFRKGYPFQKSLEHSANPSPGVEGSLLDWACDDYIKPILERLKDLPELIAECKPLTRMQTICGIAGRRFIDRMVGWSSVGIPLGGPKENFFTRLDPKDYPDFPCPTECDEMFWRHAEEMKEAYRRGERAYPIFKACLKDEATLKTKDKVRVFQGAPMALQLLVRMYFLPIARILSVIPLLSECLVGVNATGSEWDQLAKHLRKHGPDRILAGDYSKYDLRMAAQLMFAAFAIMIAIGRFCGYSEDDTVIMKGLATDICYPVMAYNGDMIQHFGSNPSGHNLTVYINSIVNSLLFRCAYKHILRKRPVIPPFREVVALGTYGDDAKSSVKEGYDEFNHISYAKFLADRDTIFTMPDKTSKPTEYMRDDEADFLQRHNYFNQDLGVEVGVLADSSIFKSLHAVLRSKHETPQQQAMNNIGGALREWFYAGREVFEKRKAQMKVVAEMCEIAHGIPGLLQSYDERVAKWHETYGTNEQ
jgi:hypothetical protein